MNPSQRKILFREGGTHHLPEGTGSTWEVTPARFLPIPSCVTTDMDLCSEGLLHPPYHSCPGTWSPTALARPWDGDPEGPGTEQCLCPSLLFSHDTPDLKFSSLSCLLIILAAFITQVCSVPTLLWCVHFWLSGLLEQGENRGP